MSFFLRYSCLAAILFLHISLTANAQNLKDTVFYNQQWTVTTRENAFYFRAPITRHKGVYTAIDRYLNGQIQMKGQYLSFDPDIKTGTFSFYDTSGNLYSIENYQNGLMHGATIFYITGTRKPLKELYFSKGKLNGVSSYYYEPSGTIAAVIPYLNNKQTGTAKNFSPTGKLIGTTVFKTPETGFRTYYDTLGRVIEEAFVNDDILLNGALKRYDPATGHLRYIMNYKNDTLDGLTTIYDVQCQNVIKKGLLKMGKREGLWLFYHSCDTNLAASGYTKNGLSDGLFTAYDTKTRTVIRQGMDSADVETGEWRYYFAGTKQVSMIRNYKNGIFNGELTTYYASGKLRRREIYEDGTMVKWNCYTETGKDTIYYTRYAAPEYPRDYQNLLNHQIQYPEAAIRENLEGVVTVRVHIDEQGRIFDTRVVKSSNKIFNREAERLGMMIPIFSPARDDGQPIISDITIPISFTTDNVNVSGGDF